MDRAESTALLREARAGSPGALDALYTRVAGRLLALIRLRLGPELRAQLESGDVLQSTLLKSFQHIDEFEGTDGTTLMAWLARIAEHEIRDRVDFAHRQRRDVRRDAPIDEMAGGPASPGRSALSAMILDEEAQRLERAIDVLSPAHREIILLRGYEERSFREIGQRLGKTEDACRMLFARAMAALTIAVGEPA